MINYENRPSGLVVPKSRAVEKDRVYTPLEIRDPAKRQLAEQAMSQLWAALSLADSGMGIPRDRLNARKRFFDYINRELLGDECPEFEQAT